MGLVLGGQPERETPCFSRQVAAERYGFDEKEDGGETVGNSLGRAPLGGNGWKQRLGGRRGNRGK